MKTMTKFATLAALGLMIAAGPAMARGMGGYHGHDCQDRETPLTTTQVKDIIEGRIAWMGDDLVVGKVEKGQDGKIVAEVNKADGTLDHKVQVDPESGRFKRLR